MDNAIKLIKQRGTTLLEALVATAIISVGFIAIFQMVTYSVSSIDVSGERTKVNYLADMIFEDLNAYKNSENNSTKLYDALIDNRTGTGMAFWEQEGAEGCAPNPGIQAPVNNAETNIRNIWDTRFSQRRLNCNPAVVNSQRLNTYTICRDNIECSNQNNDILDKMYFGQLQITFGSKSKNLYFRIH